MGCMVRKAQAEMALILGLLVIAAIVGIYSYSSFTAPGSEPVAIAEEQRGAEAYVRDVILTSSMESLRKIYSQGGFYDPNDAAQILEYANSEVAYWQICDRNIGPPDIEEEVAKSIEGQLLKNLPEKTDIAGRQVVFSLPRLEVTARVYENKVSITVNLPTTVDGISLPQPYRLELESKLGRIYEFAMDFANYQKGYRILDQNLLDHIRLSNPNEEDEGACWLPTDVFQSSTFRRSWTRIEECMREQIYHTLSRTYEWKKPWRGPDGTIPVSLLDNAYIFQIKKRDGTWGQYADLDMEFYYGGESEHLAKNDPEFYVMTDPYPLFCRARGIPGVLSFASCDVKYDVSFPVVISVEDEKMRKKFNFATFVNIRNGEPSNDGCMVLPPPDPATERCRNDLTDNMNLNVVNKKDQPLSDVYMAYGPCEFEYPTANDGIFSFAAPDLSGTNVISLYHGPTGTDYNVSATTEQLTSDVGMTVRMSLNREYDMHFYSAVISTDSISLRGAKDALKKMTVTFTMTDVDPSMSMSYSYNNKFRDMNDININVGGVDPLNPDGNGVIVDPDAVHTIRDIVNGVVLAANQTYSVTVSIDDGPEFSTGNFEADMDADDIYIFAPNIISGTSPTNSQAVELFESCGFGLVSHTKPSDLIGKTCGGRTINHV